MKISILTQSLGRNYGGLLQAYALQTYLRAQGHEVETVDRRKWETSTISRFKTGVQNAARYALGGPRFQAYKRNISRHLINRIKRKHAKGGEVLNYQELVDFRDRHIHMSERIASESAIRRHYRKKPADVVIVGSDQVWRPCYSPSIRNFYLDFLDDIALDSYVNGRNPVKRISYAASFGVDSWEYTPEQTAACSALAKKFDAVSVREQSAQVLCREHLGVSAEWVIDPTLLLEASDYEALMPDSGASAHTGKLLAYILDPAEDKQDIAEKLAGILELDVFSVKPERERTEVRYGQIDEYQCPAVEDWLQGFRDAAFVVTDSFHGCVFSIIFNKPFVAVGNPERGLARFESLLQLFELQDRLVSTPEQVNGKLASAAIDWARVNRIRHTKAEEAKAFLRRHLEQCVAGRDSPKNMSNPDLAKQRGQPDQ